MGFSDERDYQEEMANQRLMDEEAGWYEDDKGRTYDKSGNRVGYEETDKEVILREAYEDHIRDKEDEADAWDEWEFNHETDIPWLNTQMRHLAQRDPDGPYQAITEALDKSDIPPEYAEMVYTQLYIIIDRFLGN